MEKTLESINLCFLSPESNGSQALIDEVLHEDFVKQLTCKELDVIIDYSLKYFASPSETPRGDNEKNVTSHIIKKLHSCRAHDCNNSILHFAKKILFDSSLTLSDSLYILRRILTVENVEKATCSYISNNFMALMNRLKKEHSLPALLNISAFIVDHPRCLSPPDTHKQICIEIINQVSTLEVPSNNKIELMQNVINISLAIEKLWLNSSKSQIILPCLAHVYSLMANDIQKTLSPCLASVLNVAPSSHIDIALDKLLGTTGFSEDVQIKTVATRLCEWMVEWPKALRISQWIIRLFRMLTLDNRSSIVAQVLADKGPVLMEKSIVPIIRHSTAPTLPYILLTIRDQPYRQIENILHSSGRLFNFLKLQQKIDESAAQLRAELADSFYIIADKMPCLAAHTNEMLLAAFKEFKRPSEQVVVHKLNLVPALFGSLPARKLNGPIVLDVNWLNDRTPTGKIGLINLGNTCYANAVVQALSMNHNFTRAVVSLIPANNQLILSKLQQVLGFLLFSFRAAYSPAVFIKTSRPPWFEAGRQQDCSEFFRYLIDMMYEQESAIRPVIKCNRRWTVGDADILESQNHREVLKIDTSLETETLSDFTPPLKQSEHCTQENKFEHLNSQHIKKSLVHEIFGGTITTVNKCLECGTESRHQDFFTDLHLAFPDCNIDATTEVERELTVDYLLERYFEPEKLGGDNRYHCDRCGKLVDEAERTQQIDEGPNHLLLTLMRFRYDRENQRKDKITCKVKYSRTLNLKLSDRNSSLYVLYAVIVHSGITLDAGHYYTLARTSEVCSGDLNETVEDHTPWYLFDDSQVSKTDLNTIISLSSKYPNHTPYLLWYKRAELPDNSSTTCQTEFPTLPTELKRLVDDDNAVFVRERLRLATRSTNISLESSSKDDDDQDNSQGGIHKDNSNSRYVF